MRNKLIKKSIKDTFLYFFGSSASKLASFFIIPFINTFFSVEEFGRYDLFLLTSTFVSWVIGLGLDSGFSIKIVDNKDNRGLLSSLFTKSVLFSVAFWCLLFFLVFTIHFIFDLHYFSNYEIILLFLYVLFVHISGFVFNFLRWYGESKKAAFIGALSSIVGIGIGATFVYFANNPDINTFILGIVIGAFLGAFFSCFLVKGYFSFHNVFNDNTEFKDLLKISLPFVPSYLTKYFASYSDRFLIMFLLSDLKFIGMYALFYRIAQIFNTVLMTISSGFLPVMLDNYKTIEGKSFIRRIYHYILLTVVVVLVFSYLFKDFLLRVLGAKNYDLYASYKFLLPISIVSFLTYSLMNFNGFGYIIKKKTINIVYINITGIALNFVFAFCLFGYFDFSAIVLSTLLSSVFTSFIYTYLSERLYKFGYNIKLTLLCYVFIVLLSFGMIYNK